LKLHPRIIIGRAAKPPRQSCPLFSPRLRPDRLPKRIVEVAFEQMNIPVICDLRTGVP